MPGFTFDLTIVLVIALVGAMLFLPQFIASRIEAGRRAKAEWSNAQLRADMLLEELLTTSEYQQLNERRYLEVVSPSNPERAYRLPRAPGRVAVFERGASPCVRTTFSTSRFGTARASRSFLRGVGCELLVVLFVDADFIR